MSLVRKIAVNNFYLLFERLFTAFLGFLVTIWLIRYLGPDKFGTYSIVFAWFTFLNVFTPGMIEQVVAREAVRFPLQMRKYLGAGLAIKIALALIGWAIGMVAASLLGYDRKIIFYLAIVLLGLIGNASFVLQVPHQIDLKLLRPSLADGAANILYQIGRALAILLSLGLLPLFWLYLAYRILQLAFFFLLGLEKKEYRPSWGFSFGEVREIFRASWILLLINFFVMVIGRIDHLMIYSVLGNRPLGLYGSCSNLTDYMIMIPTTWYLSVFPLLSRYLGESPEAYQKASHYTYKYLTIAIVCFWIAFGGFSRESLALLFGSDYVQAQGALFWLSAAIVFAFLYYGLFNAALSRHQEKLWLLVNGLGALLNVCLNLILIPSHGIAGAGFATFAAFLLQVILTGILGAFRPDFRIMLRAAGWPVLLGAAIVLTARFLELKLIFWLSPMIVIYLILLVVTRTINRNDLKLILKAVRPGEP